MKIGYTLMYLVSFYFLKSSINESMNEPNLKNNEVHKKLLQNDRQDMKRIEKNYYINDVMKIMLEEQ